MMLPNFAAITGVPAERIRLHARDVGGGFGIRSQAYPEYSALMHAAKALGRPVKWVGSRFETIVSDHHGRAAIDLTGELGARPRRPLRRAARALDLQHGRASLAGGSAHQHGQPLDACDQRLPHPGALRAAPARAHQHHLDHRVPRRRPAERVLPRRAPGGRGRARDSASIRVELRRRNLIPKEAFPYKTPVGSTYDSGDPPGQLDDRSRSIPDWKALQARRETVEEARQAARHRLRHVRRALRRRRGAAGAGGDQVRRIGQRVALRAVGPVRARRTRRCFRYSSRRFWDCRQTRSS